MSIATRASFALSIALVAAGCATTARAPEGPAPSYADVVQRNNARVAQLESIWSRVTVEAHFLDENGRKTWEQGRGHLQFVQPDHLALSVGKYSELFFWFGTDGRRFWAINTEERVARVGSLDDEGFVTIDSIAGPALPANPEQLALLLGLGRLPEPDARVRAPRVEWNDGAWEFEIRNRWGTVRVGVDPVRLEPRRVALLDEQGTLRLRSTLEEYGGVRVPDRAGDFPRVSTFVTIEEPARDMLVKIRLSEGRERREIPSQVFDFEHLIDAYAILHVEPL